MFLVGHSAGIIIICIFVKIKYSFINTPYILQHFHTFNWLKSNIHSAVYGIDCRQLAGQSLIIFAAINSKRCLKVLHTSQSAWGIGYGYGYGYVRGVYSIAAWCSRPSPAPCHAPFRSAHMEMEGRAKVLDTSQTDFFFSFQWLYLFYLIEYSSHTQKKENQKRRACHVCQLSNVWCAWWRHCHNHLGVLIANQNNKRKLHFWNVLHIKITIKSFTKYQISYKHTQII